MPRHFADLDLLPADTLRAILDAAAARKRSPSRHTAELTGQTLAMVFEKPSTRTRVSFELAMKHLGGHALTLDRNAINLGRGETVADTARVLSRYVDAIMIRATSHRTLEEFATHATIPVINGLTPRSHPCQVMADVLTFEEHRGPIAGRRVAWLGDGDNVAVSWIHAAVQLGFSFALACPQGFEPEAATLAWAKKRNGDVVITRSAAEALEGATCVVTDTWMSMNAHEKDRMARASALAPYRVTADAMARADEDAIFMHCLPAFRGEEVAADVIDGPASVVLDEAENRLHAQKSILAWCLGASAP